MAELSNCPQCGAPVNAGLRECKYCDAVLIQQAEAAEQIETSPQDELVSSNGHVKVRITVRNDLAQGHQTANTVTYVQDVATEKRVPKKSKMTAGLLAIFLGCIGVHKFYLGKWVWGIVYLAFCWTYIPAIIGFIEGIVYLASTDDKFVAKHGGYR